MYQSCFFFYSYILCYLVNILLFISSLPISDFVIFFLFQIISRSIISIKYKRALYYISLGVIWTCFSMSLNSLPHSLFWGLLQCGDSQSVVCRPLGVPETLLGICRRETIFIIPGGYSPFVVCWYLHWGCIAMWVKSLVLYCKSRQWQQITGLIKSHFLNTFFQYSVW